MSISTVCTLGLGYIGLPTSAIIARSGIKVIGVDTNPNVIESLNQGSAHIYEPGLSELVKEVTSNGHLSASLSPMAADVFVIAVPTPFKKTDSSIEPDISYIKSACESIAPVLNPNNLVILESTAPVGTTQLVCDWLAMLRQDLSFPTNDSASADINIAYCPERVLPGNIIHELTHNDRIVGGISSQCTTVALSFYHSFVSGECLPTNARTAEMAKLSENAFRDVNIAFANELATICEQLDIDIWNLTKLTNKHPRVNILQPGPGVGGHCIAVDPWFIVNSAPDTANLIKLSRQINDSKPLRVAEQIKAAATQFESPTIACMGLSYKPNIGDLRESPSIAIVTKLIEQRIGEIRIFEPHITELPTSIKQNNVALCSDYADLEQTDIVVFLVNHQQFKGISNSHYNHAIIIDSCGFSHFNL